MTWNYPPKILPKTFFSKYSDVIYQNNGNFIQSKTIRFIFLDSEFYFLFFTYKDAVHKRCEEVLARHT